MLIQPVTNQTSQIVGLDASLAGKQDRTRLWAHGHSLLPRRVVATGGQYPDQLSGTGNLGATARKMHLCPQASCDLQLLYGNYHGADVALGNVITLAAVTVEYPAGTFWPVYFGGQTSITLASGGHILSDPVGVDIPANTAFYTRTFVTVTSTTLQWPEGGSANTIGLSGEGSFRQSSSPTDNTQTVGTAWINDAVSSLISPIAIVGTSFPVQPSLLLLGDSYADGTNDTGGGHVLRGINNTLPYIRCALSGSGMRGWVTAPAQHIRRVLLGAGCTHVLCELGTNDDTSTGTSIASFLQSIAAQFGSRGLKTIPLTVMPNNVSLQGGGSWTGTPESSNQNPDPQNTNRIAYNNLLRGGTVVSGSSGNIPFYIEVTNSVEPSVDSGIWKAGYSDVTTHPNAVGSAAAGVPIAAALSGLTV